MVQQLQFLKNVLNMSAERYLRSAGDLFVYEGDYESALMMVDKTLAIQPEDTRALVLRGDILYCLNKDFEALSVFNKVLDKTPSCIEAYVSKASVLEVMGKYREALTSCNTAFELIQAGSGYLLPTLFDQKLMLLTRLRKIGEAHALLEEAKERLKPSEFEFLHVTYRPILNEFIRYKQNRRTKRGNKPNTLRIV